MKISESEALRYLGYGRAAAPAELVELIRTLSSDLQACLNPKSAFEIYDCRVDLPIVTLGDMTINSARLAVHLKDCRRAALLAATLGTGADALIRRYSVLDMEKALVVQAVCTAMLEAYCCRIEGEIAQNIKKTRMPDDDELYLKTRFSPGYGDFDMVHQKDILRLLDCGSRIGLTLTDGYMLAPSKSVTAVVGMAKERRRGREVKGKCESCSDKLCAFREMKI